MIRALLLIGALAGALVALATGSFAAPTSPQPTAPATATGFIHVDHSIRLEVRGKEIPCVDCHDLDARGRVRSRPDHDACFGACHGARPRPGRAIDPERRELCETCHAPGSASVAYPPYDLAPDFAITISHASHAQVDDGCRRCHDAPDAIRPRRGVAHGRCAGCHASEPEAPAMTACKACHRDAVGPLRGPTMRQGSLPVADTFSHRRHLPRSRGACRPCHDGAAAATGDTLPAPGKAECGACHDGAAAFSMTEPACRQCHRTPVEAPARRAPELTPARFSHDEHPATATDCSPCHELARDGSPRAVSTHASCDGADCHRSDFAERGAAVCGVCHVGDEPWRPLHVDRRPPPTTEFGVIFSHAGHDMAEGDAACRGCHGEGAPSLLRDHARCSGDACHERGSGTPPLDACDDCHRAGLAAARARVRKGDRWSVRDRFAHDSHAIDPRTASPLPCTSCHTDAASATHLATAPTPAKATCLPCHDGAIAFKMTGHSCARCHDGGSAQNGQSPQTK